MSTQGQLSNGRRKLTGSEEALRQVRWGGRAMEKMGGRETTKIHF